MTSVFMKRFSGFPAKGTLIKIPGVFFDELLPQINTLVELKVTLYCILRMQQKEGHVPYLWHSEITADASFMLGMGPNQTQQEAALEEGLECAVARGTLLSVRLNENGQSEFVYFMNSPRGQEAIRNIEAGKWLPSRENRVLYHAVVQRPNIFTLYEQNIGPMTGLIGEHLRDLEETYSEEWVREAIEIAVLNNARKLQYISAILKRWKEEGRPSRTGDWYIDGKYSDEIEH